MVDLKELKGVELVEEENEDGKGGTELVARVGPGMKWIDVYDILEPQGLTVAGARSSNVGVGGFILGGKY